MTTSFYQVPVGISAIQASDGAQDFTFIEHANNIYEVSGSFVPTWVARVAATTPTQDQINLATCPQTVTAAQAKIALNNAGLLSQVTTYMATAPMNDQIAWQEATEFNVSSPTLAAMAIALNLTSAQLNALFLAASAVVL